MAPQGYIVKGWTHLLAGWWRLGKSEFLAAVILPWIRTGLRVLWITEEPESLWADRADMLDEIYEPVPWEGHLTLMDAMSATPGQMLDRAATIDADVVIADTIREVCGIVSIKDDDEIRKAVTPWLRRLRDGRRTLIFLTQHRKAAGERGERVEGTVALPSMMDVVLELEAVEGNERQRRLTVRRRRSQTVPLLYEMDDEERFIVVPDARSHSRIEVENAAFEVVNASTEPLKTADVRRKMNPKPHRDTMNRALTSLSENGRIRRDPPIGEDAERRTVKWFSATPTQTDLP
jgi:predicted ATP-dependent serine protease